MQYIYKVIKILFKAKIIFSLPLKKEIVIFDHGVDQLQFLKKNKFIIFYTRGEEINIYILLKTIFEKGFSNFVDNYRITFLKFLNPKYIITYRCDNRLFYELNFFLKYSKTILIQWGKTTEGYFQHYKKTKSNFYVDQMYFYGEETENIFSKFIKGKTFSIGSITNNRYKFNEKIKKKSLIFISQAKSGRIFPEIEKLILGALKNFCIKNNLRLSVSTRVHNKDKHGKKNYNDVLNGFEWDYHPRKLPNAYGDYQHYKKVMTSEYVVFMDSTLGYEALSRKKKVVALPFGSFSPNWCKQNYRTNKKNNDFYVPSKFGYPLKFNSEGKFWLSFYNLDKIEEKLNFMLNINDVAWLNLLKEIEIDKIVKFDLYNKTLITNLKKIGIPLQKDRLMK